MVFRTLSNVIVKKTLDTDVLVFVSGNESDVKGSVSFIPRDQIPKGDEIIDCHKVFIAKAGSGSDTFPHLILGKPFYGSPNTACNESYLVIGPFLNKRMSGMFFDFKRCGNLVP